eukprot:CAMPEP_0194483922 /NCGR_PEP_ID=MMETSP0253-20130528/5418_1 /TAXON_ID=2966 /ORGANISM="Noctiluca scintillans" /LENGTH=45 /DNA_ID= /DNA_START= /DNA_END= /DNA_ORIENTATION=
MTATQNARGAKGAAYGTVDVVTGIRFMVATGTPVVIGIVVMGLVA